MMDTREIDTHTDTQADNLVLSMEDMAAVVRLLGEVADMEAPPAARKRRLMLGLAEMISADACLWVVSRIRDDEVVAGVEVLHEGLDEEGLTIFYQASYDQDTPMLEYEAMFRIMAQGKPATRRRQQLVDDDAWYAHPQVERYRKRIGLDQSIMSFHPLGHETWSCIGFHRTWGRPAFTPYESRLVHVVLSEIPWLHGAGCPNEAELTLPLLPRRLRIVLGLLLDGWERARIATHLSLSEATVRSYTSEIYRHFQVRSQRELIGRFRMGDGADLD